MKWEGEVRREYARMAFRDGNAIRVRDAELGAGALSIHAKLLRLGCLGGTWAGKRRFIAGSARKRAYGR